jgi:hypothetical protein
LKGGRVAFRQQRQVSLILAQKSLGAIVSSKPFVQQSVALSRLHLDSHNPRHDITEDEPLIIEQLVKAEQIFPLAEDICARGLSPLERLAAIPHPTLDGHFVMVEGNRRLCSLKLLRDPAKAPASERKAFKRLAERKPSLPRSLEIAVFLNRDLANRWIALKHGGQQGGIGTKNWTASQSSRFKNSLVNVSRPNSLALAVLDYAVDAGILTTEQRSGVALTTVTRYLTNPVVRSALGLTSPSEFLINIERSEFDVALSRFLEDVLTGTVHSRSKATDRADYGRNLIASGSSPITKLSDTYSPTDLVAPPQKTNPAAPADAAAGVTPAPRRNNRSPDLGTKIVRAGYAAHISDHTTKRVFDELRDIDALKFTFASAALLRLFMERVCRAYAKKCGLGDTGDLAPLIGRCANHMEQKAGASKSVFQIWRSLSSNPLHYLSPGTLGTYIHGGTTPVLSELRRGWTDLEEGFTLMLDAIR